MAILAPNEVSGSLQDPVTVVRKEPQVPPNIYTFFEMNTKRDGTKDIDAGHEFMLEAWKSAWAARGWNPIILTLDDAKKHPDFDYYSNQFMKLSSNEAFIFGGSYNYMCLMRWLAMAAQRVDGWMSDYDTYPLHITSSDGHYLPNGGKFTVFERYVPSLISASASEWDRLAIDVIEQVLDKFAAEGTQVRYSDMYALEDLWNKSPEENRVFIAILRVDSYPYAEMHKMDCEKASNLLALHLAHSYTRHARDHGLIPDSLSDNERYKYSTVIEQDWQEQCASNRLNLRH